MADTNEPPVKASRLPMTVYETRLRGSRRRLVEALETAPHDGAGRKHLPRIIAELAQLIEGVGK